MSLRRVRNLEAQTAIPRGAHLGPFKYLSFGRSHVGKVRTLNEDAWLERSDVGLWAVADGMGGHDAGEVASAMLVEALAGISTFSSAYAFRHAVCAAVQHVNRNLIELATLRRSGPVGATIVCLMAYQSHYACVWAGDSRCYHLRGGALRRVSRDHSLVQEMIESGALKPEDASRHRKSNIITRAVGASEVLQLDSVHGRLEAGDRFLLCSDGLTTMVNDSEIAFMLARPPLEASVERLLELALHRGAPDNVTLTLVGVERANN